MDQKFLEYVRHLSKNDKKTLSQKALKTCEEVGELARVILPYDNAFATNHRFVKSEQILEEAVDTVLTAISVAYDLDFTDEQIEEMFRKKADKWAELQKNEDNLKYPIPYEIHITVVPQGFDTESVNNFKQTCHRLEVKPIILDLHHKTGKIEKDIMSSSTHYGTNASAYEELKRISNGLHKDGYKVIREKIETVPWHPAAPQTSATPMPKDCYFEAHIAVSFQPGEYFTTQLHLDNLKISLCDWNVHVSQNILKHDKETGRSTVFITYRTKGPIGKHDPLTEDRYHFDNTVDTIVAYISINMADTFTVEKVHKEFSIFDTNVGHDTSWLSQNS